MPHCHFGICPSGRMLLQTLLTFVLLPDSDISAPRSALLRIDRLSLCGSVFHRVRFLFHEDGSSFRTASPVRILHITFPYNVVHQNFPAKNCCCKWNIYFCIQHRCPFRLVSRLILLPLLLEDRSPALSAIASLAFLFHGVLHFFPFQCPPVYEPAEIV